MGGFSRLLSADRLLIALASFHSVLLTLNGGILAAKHLCWLFHFNFRKMRHWIILIITNVQIQSLWNLFQILICTLFSLFMAFWLFIFGRLLLVCLVIAVVQLRTFFYKISTCILEIELLKASDFEFRCGFNTGVWLITFLLKEGNSVELEIICRLCLMFFERW